MNRKIYMSIAIVSLAIVSLFGGSSCSDDTVDKTCTVAFVKNINKNQVGDTVFVKVQAGELCAEIPELTNGTKTFGGWFTNVADANIAVGTKPTFTQPYDLEQKPIYLDVILYARWIN